MTFSEAVQGIDVTDLVLSGTAATRAIKSAPTNLGSNTWRFPVSGLVNGTLNVSLAPDANDIEDLAGNDLVALAWTYSVAIAVAQQPPVLAAIPDQVIANGTLNGPSISPLPIPMATHLLLGLRPKALNTIGTRP